MKTNAVVKLPHEGTASSARPHDKDDEEPATPKAAKASMPMGLPRAIIASVVLASLTYGTVSLLTDRYALVPPTQSANAFIYRIDRLTGKVSFCTQNSCTAIGNRTQND